MPTLDPASTAALDIERFRHFSDSWLMSLPGDPTGRPSIGDFRYGVQPGEIRPLWAIRLDLPNPHRHAEYLTMREVRPGDLERFFNMVQGGPPLAPFPP